MKILVVRNDKLGDLLVTLPGIACIKENLPESNITLLCPEYTKDIAKLCHYIDDFLVDPGRENGPGATLQLSKEIKKRGFDAVVTFFSTGHTGFAVWFARIPYRLAPATKIAQLAYNHRLKQRRSESIKPEHEYNLDLAKAFLNDMGVLTIKNPRPPYLSVPKHKQQQIRKAFSSTYQVSESAKLVFIHVGSGGSSKNLSLEQYAKLIRLLDIKEPYHWVLSAGPGEIERVKKLSELISGLPHTVYESKTGLPDFVDHVSLADLFIGGSTGPLHIAGALDIPTAAFYVRLQTSSPLRWQTVNSPSKRLSFSPENSFGEEDMSGVDLDRAAGTIRETFIQY